MEQSVRKYSIFKLCLTAKFLNFQLRYFLDQHYIVQQKYPDLKKTLKKQGPLYQNQLEKCESKE
jgi:hypothetical protein